MHSESSFWNVSIKEVGPAIDNHELDLIQDDIREHEEKKLPFNKADYMKMSVAEKVTRYPFDTKGTNSAFGMVKAYFEIVGLSTEKIRY